MIDLQSKKILITGAHAFLGPHLVKNLVEKHHVPHENISVPRKSEFDLRYKKNAQRAVEGKDIVMHLASVTGDIEFHHTHPGELFYDNLIMGVHVMEAARIAGIEKFVTIGSATEYPASPPVPFKEENLWDGVPEEFHVPYAIAKKMLFVQAQAYQQEYGFCSIHLLLTNMFGPGFNKESTFVIPSLIRRIHEAKISGSASVVVWGTGKATRDFLYVEDAAEGVVRATEYYAGSDPVNMGSGIEVSIAELARMLCRLMGYRGEIQWDHSYPDGQPRRVLDITRAEKEFGFQPIVDLETGLRRSIKYFESMVLYVPIGE